MRQTSGYKWLFGCLLILGLLSSGIQRLERPAQAAGPRGQYLQFSTLDLQPASQQVGTAAAQVFGWYIYNNATSPRYVKVYNAASADQTATPALTIGIPASSGANVAFPDGIPFTTACCLRGTTGVAANDTGAPTANDLVVNVFYGAQQ